jgi:hypothetical protein
MNKIFPFSYYYQLFYSKQLNCTVTVNSETLGNANLQVLKP